MERTTRLRTMWNARTDTWHDHVTSSPAFEKVRAAVLTAAGPAPDDHVVDLGAGSGFLALALAPEVRDIVAVDISDEMLERLRNSDPPENVRTRRADLASVDFPAASLDLVVSSYALHHLVDADKAALVARARTWLRPGGRMVVADMMFGRGRTNEDRKIIQAKVRSLVRKGPGGVWRIAKNAVRFGLRRGTELPATPEFWTDAFRRAGFRDVQFTRIVAEAGLVVGTAPSTPAPSTRAPSSPAH